MKRVILIHFKPEEAAERLERLRRAGHNAEYEDVYADRGLRRLRANPPDAVVIDLARQPYLGKEVGLAIRKYAATRTLPLLFIEAADPEKTEKVRVAIPDAIFSTWDKVGKQIERARRTAPIESGYSGTPLPKKLGIKAGTKVMTLGAPQLFEESLGALPDGAEFVRAGKPDLLLIFASMRDEMEFRFAKAIRIATEKTRIWIAWPKRTSGVASDLNETLVREFGLAMGWVDFKVCAINKTWSGLLFAPKKEAGARRLRPAAS